MSDRCRSCQAEVVFVPSAKTGKPMILDANPGLAAISAPTLVIVGEHDALTPPLAAANLAAQIRGSGLIHIAGAGHLSNMERPEEFTELLQRHLRRCGLNL